MSQFFFFAAFLSSLAFAQGKATKSHSHSSQGPHVHGQGELALAFEGLQGKVEFEAPAESLIGFEHSPKTEGERKELEKANRIFEELISKIVLFDPSLNCKFQKEALALEVDPHEKHAEYHARFKVQCEKKVVGTKVSVDFSAFPKLKKVNITVLADEIQKNALYQNKPVQVELK